MTHREIRTAPDGTRLYENWDKYKPVPLEERKYGINKPDVPGAVRFHTRWFLPLPAIDDDARVMPETIPDGETLKHRALCRCQVCTRPGAEEIWAAERRGRAQRFRS